MAGWGNQRRQGRGQVVGDEMGCEGRDEPQIGMRVDHVHRRGGGRLSGWQRVETLFRWPLSYSK